MAAVIGWPGQSAGAWVLPGAVAALVGSAAGPRAGLWQLAAVAVPPAGELAKRAVGRPRPVTGLIDLKLIGRRSPSFPSTHVVNYVTILGLAAWLMRVRRSKLAIPVGVLALGLVGAIGPSRVRTGDHRWSDVAGGYALGFACLAALLALAGRDSRLRRGHRAAGQSESFSDMPGAPEV